MVMAHVFVIVHDLAETQSYTMNNVRVTECVPGLEKSLPSALAIHEHENFKYIDYPTIKSTQCDLLLGMDNSDLIMQCDDLDSHRVSGDLHATFTPDRRVFLVMKMFTKK